MLSYYFDGNIFVPKGKIKSQYRSTEVIKTILNIHNCLVHSVDCLIDDDYDTDTFGYSASIKLECDEDDALEHTDTILKLICNVLTSALDVAPGTIEFQTENFYREKIVLITESKDAIKTLLHLHTKDDGNSEFNAGWNSALDYISIELDL